MWAKLKLSEVRILSSVSIQEAGYKFNMLKQSESTVVPLPAADKIPQLSPL